ncbi:uncharacterized protein LOC109535537 [Dendroctonus ponderosae]|uniref:uncharacterized protein LOC109535537 n=1 Tax=Dendroctonus ponderosae TaxID=77166 RepID=UPI0020360421|nr:uncharacterized protein LOC109535537 [Dendroctonus ponderosae]XP_019757011.2 uncharacterized protein LOC109535537 [Dendroctonus ponderosae]
MANFSEAPVPNQQKPATNCEGTQEQIQYSSESDALVIDEGLPKRKKNRNRKQNKKNKVSDEVKSEENTEDSISNQAVQPDEILKEELKNPFFNESLFELSQTHRTIRKPKLKEYAQYLGLQPAVQFKCPKCGKSGFESLSTLQDHFLQQCSPLQPLDKPGNKQVSGFKLTRRVFLCSACGTYYENWNLYMHMLEYHRRFICLYCLGMFSSLEPLCQHIHSRHKFKPAVRNTPEEFYTAYREPCYLVCCECHQQFTERDNFFYHSCIKPVKAKSKHSIAPENHVTGDFSEIPTESGEEGEKTPAEPDKQISNNPDMSKHSESDSSECEDKIENVEGVKSPSTFTMHQSQHENIQPAQPTDAIRPEPLDEDLQTCLENTDIQCETRKVPKLSLKLPKPVEYLNAEDSDDSDKFDKDIDNVETENEQEDLGAAEEPEQDLDEQDNSALEVKAVCAEYPIAGSEVTVIEIQLDQPLDKMNIVNLLQKCLRATVSSCIYCNHSRRIAVNGRQLALHAMAEHRYSAINKSITEEELIPDSFNIRIRECLGELESTFFNLDSGVSNEAVTFSHMFECFQCHYSTSVHKELYLHNRKYHSKNRLLCIMCKCNFYSYSELICHLCPGVYILDYDMQYRCCLCINDDLPSAFRLMVHLRKRHNICDVCLELCHSQYKLSNHVWKHKLHHFCYRCAIAYRNKADITRHLFWKHGTESVCCKKCLQKKWPHVYHFCVPPAFFVCEDCNLALTKAVSLKVHKRLHTDEKKHACQWENCTECFISKKIMLKHFKWHTDPPEETKVKEINNEPCQEVEESGENVPQEEVPNPEDESKPVRPKVDVYDLPALNLSESDSSDSENDDQKSRKKEDPKINCEESACQDAAEVQSRIDDSAEVQSRIDDSTQEQSRIDETVCEIVEQQPKDDMSSTVMQDIWDNFKNYQANKEKMDHILIGEPDSKVNQPYVPDIPIPIVEEGISSQLALLDHDYCADPESTQPTDAIIEVKPSLDTTESIDHDYCFQTEEEKVPVQPEPLPEDESKTNKKPNSSSSSSSDSDSSCACGSSCSCSDSSSSSSSSDSSNSDSSTEEGRKRQQQRRLKRKERNQLKKIHPQLETELKVDVVTADQPVVPSVAEIRESDLETTESETDEEFYDREPQKFAKKILAEKRAQLLTEMGSDVIPNGSFFESTSRPPTPPAGTLEEETANVPKKKKKSKKRKKRKSEKKITREKRSYTATIVDSDSIVPVPPASIPYYQQFHQVENQVAPITLSLSRNSPVIVSSSPPQFDPSMDTQSSSRQETVLSDSSVRASKRRRVPNKFYGYSSDEDAERPSSMKRPKMDINRTIPAPQSPRLVPPITIKTVPSPLALPTRQPMVEPITLRLPKPHVTPGEFKHRGRVPPIRLLTTQPPVPPSKEDSASESNDSDQDELVSKSEPPKLPQPQLYCYCRCPYDEVSEMIGCDSNDCEIEWFHFECVGIMVPPKGQWFCPDCRKKKQQQRS